MAITTETVTLIMGQVGEVSDLMNDIMAALTRDGPMPIEEVNGTRVLIRRLRDKLRKGYELVMDTNPWPADVDPNGG